MLIQPMLIQPMLIYPMLTRLYRALRALSSELEHYGGLKSAIQELSKQADKTRMELDLLQTQNRDLNVDNQRIISSLVHSTHTFDVMHGFVNSLRNELLGLVSISAYITCSIGLQFEYLEKLKSSNGDGFAMLGSAFSSSFYLQIRHAAL